MAYWFLLILPLQKQGPITEISRLGAKVRKPSRKFSASLRERQRCQVHFHHGSNLSLALKRKTPTCLWRRKQEPFSSRATTGTRGQEVTSHADSLACLTANLSCSCRCAGIEEVTPLATEVPSARHRHRCCARGEEGAEGVGGGRGRIAVRPGRCGSVDWHRRRGWLCDRCGSPQMLWLTGRVGSAQPRRMACRRHVTPHVWVVERSCSALSAKSPSPASSQASKASQA